MSVTSLTGVHHSRMTHMDTQHNHKYISGYGLSTQAILETGTFTKCFARDGGGVVQIIGQGNRQCPIIKTHVRFNNHSTPVLDKAC